MVTSWGESMPYHVSVKLLLSSMVTQSKNKQIKIHKYRECDLLIFWQSLDGTRKWKEKSTQEDIEDGDRESRRISVVG